MIKRIFEFVMHQVQLDIYILEMHVRHYLIIYLHEIKAGNLLSVLKIQIKKRNIEGGEESQLKVFKMAWHGMG